MKEVLISIQPKWCELMLRGKKTVEVRKTRPKLKTPFKCYIYQTKGKERLVDVMKDGDDCYGQTYHGKPVFIKVRENSGYDGLFGREQKVIGEFICDYIYENMSYDCEDSCVSVSELQKYANGKQLYGWHISGLKIYDEPKELIKFKKPCNHNCFAPCPHYRGKEYECEKPIITRPPQSWCYVEVEE